MTAIRKLIVKAIKDAERGGAKRATGGNNVIPFPKQPGTKKRRRKGGAKRVQIRPTQLSPVAGKPGFFRDKKGTMYRVVKDAFGTRMYRQDGAVFKLNKRGNWELVKPPGGARRGRK